MKISTKKIMILKKIIIHMKELEMLIKQKSWKASEETNNEQGRTGTNKFVAK